jgi:hypothetical protein
MQTEQQIEEQPQLSGISPKKAKNGQKKPKKSKVSSN